MPVRSLRPADLVAIPSLERHRELIEVTPLTWPGHDPAIPALRPVGFFLEGLLRRSGRQRGLVASDSSELLGMALSRPRARGRAWDIERAATRTGNAGVELLEEVARRAGEQDARRVFLETPEGGDGANIARQAGFSRYSSITLHRLEPRFEVEKTDVFQGRPRLKADTHDLFQLYNAAVPAPVRSAEALTQEEWEGLDRAYRGWRPTLGGTRQHYVWELGTAVVGWMELHFGQRSQSIEMLIHPRYEDSADRFLRFAMLQVSPKAPVYVSARVYQGTLVSALHYAGFTQIGTHELCAKMLAARVGAPVAVTATSRVKVARG